MTTYTVTMDDGHKITVKAWSAADAIQTGLTKHLGHRVAACRSGDMSVGQMEGHINYDIPNHDPIMEPPAKRERASRSEETEANRIAREKPAPWLEEWLAKQKAAGKL